MANNNQFSVNIGANLVTDNVQKQLDALQAKLIKSTNSKFKIPIEFDEKGNATKFANAIKQVNTYKDAYGNLYKQTLKFKELQDKLGNGTGKFELISNPDESLTKVSSKVRELTTEVHKWTDTQGAIQKWSTTVDSSGEKIQTRVKQYINDSKELVTETSKWGRNSQGQWQQIGDTIKTITDDYKKSAQTLTTETHKWTNSKGEINNWVTSVDEAGQIIQTRTKQYTNNVGELVTETSKWGKNSQGQWQQVGETIRTITDDFKKSAQTLTTETHKFVDSKGGIQTWVTTVDDTGKTISTRTKQIVDDMGNVITTTSRLEAEAGKPFRKVGEEITKVSEIIKESTTSTNTVRGTVEDLGNTYQGLITTTEKVSSNGEYLRTVISKYTDEMGRAVEKTEQFDKAGNQVATTMRKIGEATQVSDTKRATFIDKEGNKTITEYTNGVATLRTEIKTYKDEVGNLIVQTDKYDAVTNKLISTHQELKRDIQQAVAEDKKREAELDSIITKIIAQREAQERLNKALVSTTTTYSRGKTTQFGDKSGQEYDALITKIEKVDAENQKVIQTTYEFTNAQGQLVRQTRTTDQYLNKISEDIITITGGLNNANSKLNNASSGLNNLNTSAERANYGVRNLGWSLKDAFSRLANFYLASLPIRAVQKAITETIQTVKNFDSALIEFKKVSDLAGESLTKYVDKLAEMGEITGSTMQAMVEASTEFRKSGFTDEDSAKLASIAEKYRNIADEEISAGESASFIIAQMKAFNIEADQAEHIIDSVNEVANNFSVSSADLAKNLGNMSAIMSINNVSMEEQIGMLTGVTEITRKASNASRGLVMISSRLTQVLDESSSTGKKLTAIYEGLGIELKDENGQLRSHYDILGDLAGVWNTLSENEQKYIALTSAGARQQQNFVALMENWGQVARATATAYQSMGSAQRENEKVMDSIAKKVEILKSEFQQLVIGKGGLQSFTKTILDVGIAILKFANSDIGKLIITLTLVETTLYAVSKAWAALKIASQTNVIASAITSLVAGETTLAQVTSVLSKKFIENALAFAATPMGMATIAVASIGALVYITYKWATSIDSATKNLKELSEQSQKTEGEIENLKNSLHEVRDAIKRINEKKLEITDNEQLEKLEKETKELENQELILQNQLTLAEQKLALEHKEEATQAKKTYDTKQISSYKTVTTGSNDNLDPTAMGSGAGGATTTYVQTSAIEELNLATEALKKNTEERNRNIRLAELEARQHGTNTQAYDEYQQKISLANAEIEKAQRVGIKNAETLDTVRTSLSYMGDEYKEDIENIDNATKAFTDINSASVETTENIYGIQTALDEEGDALDENAEELSEEEIALQMLADAHNVAVEDLKNWAKELGISEEALVSYADALGVSVEKAYEFKTQLNSWDEQIDLLQSSFDALNSAVEEYNSNQELSIDTVQKLLQLDPEYLTCLEEENGQLTLNKDKIIDKVNALIEERKQIAINIAHERLRKVEIGESSVAEEEHKGKVENNTDAIKKETDALLNNTRAYAAKIVAESNGKKKSAVDQIIRELNQELSMLNKIGDSYNSISSSSSKAGKSGSKAAKDAKNAQKELNKELEETKKKYEQVIKYINKRYDREIKKIKDAKSEAVKAEEKKIKAKEKEKDHALDAIEKEIKALKKEQDARKKYWSDRIDALKKQNKELKDSLELQEKLDALEKAKNTRVKVYKEGQGFVYDVDQTAVAEAQKALDEYLSEKAYEDELERLEALKDAELDNYEKRLDALNEYKDSVQENYEKQIEQMNEYKDKLSEQYDAQMDKWEEYKEKFGDLVDSYEEQQNKLLFEQLMGIKDEGNNWLTRLDNLAEFVKKYNELQSKLNTGDTNVSNTATMKQGNVSSGGTKTTGTKNTNNTSKSSQFVSSRTSKSDRWGTTLGVISKANTHASGIGSVPADEIAIVGENPNKEIVIGSKINNGELMNLGKGTGVVNADSSRTLASMLNQVGQFGASGFGSGNGTLNNNINNDSLVINGVTIQGANINDPQTFVNGLLNLKAEALQRAYRHR